MMSQNEDDVIAAAFIKIKTAVETTDWQLVCDAYFDISGEKIEPPVVAKQSRLDKIRSKMTQKSTKVPTSPVKVVAEKEEVLAEETSDWSGMSLIDIKLKLISLGAPEEEFEKIKSKQKLKAYAETFEKKKNTVKTQTIALREGKFARGQLKIISAPDDDAEKLRNARAKAQNPRQPAQKRDTELRAIEDDEREGSFAFHPFPSKLKKVRSED